MKFIVFYLQLINSLEGVGMLFSSAALIRRLRKYTATGSQKKKTCISNFEQHIFLYQVNLFCFYF